MRDRVVIFDTTLRDGEQSPGIALDADQKTEIAHQLARLGVDVIEAGFPVSSPGDFAAVERIAREVKGPTIAALARATPEDIETAWAAVRDAARPRIHVFLATSPIHMEHKLEMTPDEVKDAVRAGVALARSHCTDVEFSPEDATRSDVEFMIEVCTTAVVAGATTINIPDTVGYATPADFGALIARVVREVKGERDDVVISAHCHNDLGLAVANSLAAVENGARQVEGAVNGIGERAGNTSIEEVAMALIVRADHFGMDVGIDTREIYATSRLVEEATGYPIQFNKAVVGRNAFAHESGIHQHGVLRERTTYEIMDPAAVGQSGTQIVLGKHSGRAAFGHAVGKLGIRADTEAFEAAFTRFKEVADRVGAVDEQKLRRCFEEAGEAGPREPIAVDAGANGRTVVPGPPSRAAARELTIEYQDDEYPVVVTCFESAREALGVEAALAGYEVRRVEVEGETMADVRATVRVNGDAYVGRGVSNDIAESSARAFTAAFGDAGLGPDPGAGMR